MLAVTFTIVVDGVVHYIRLSSSALAQILDLIVEVNADGIHNAEKE